jgi:hypothetical protein
LRQFNQLKEATSDAVPTITFIPAIIASIPPEADLIRRYKTFRVQ